MTKSEEIYYIIFGIFIGYIFFTPLPEIFENIPAAIKIGVLPEITRKDWLVFSLSGITFFSGIGLIIYKIRVSSKEHNDAMNTNIAIYNDGKASESIKTFREQVDVHSAKIEIIMNTIKANLECIRTENYREIVITPLEIGPNIDFLKKINGDIFTQVRMLGTRMDIHRDKPYTGLKLTILTQAGYRVANNLYNMVYSHYVPMPLKPEELENLVKA